MSIIKKIKESCGKLFRNKKHKDDALLPFLYGLDLSEQKDCSSVQHWVKPTSIHVDNEWLPVDIVIKPVSPINCSSRVKKAKHIYHQTKNKRIKKKQLKIISSEESYEY